MANTEKKKGKKGRTGPTRTNPGDKVSRMEVLAEVVKLHRRGCSNVKIAEMLGVTRQQIHYDLKKAYEQYKTDTIEDCTALVLEKLEHIREVKWEAWQAWERSKEDAQRVRTEERATPFGITNIQSDERRGQAGDGRYLKLILECIKEEIALTGIEPPKRVDMNAKVQTLNWDSLAASVAMSTAPNGTVVIKDDVEDAIAQALGVTPERVQLGQIDGKESTNGSNGVNGHDTGTDKTE